MSKSNTKQSKNPRGCFYTPVSNSLFTSKKLTTNALQILLVLELKAGTSRKAIISNQEIQKLTGISKRTIERSLQRLRNQKLISHRLNGTIELIHPVPETNYVPVFESVVFHPCWEDWQKHILLFVMSQFRSRVSELGIPLHTLNLYGRKGLSIKKVCRIPGSPKERCSNIKEFTDLLEDENILRVFEEATSNRPAICIIDREILANIEPDYDRHRFATFRMAAPENRTHRQTKRSKTDTQNIADRQTKPSTTVTPNVAKPSKEMYVKKTPKIPKNSKKIPESPRSACGGRGAISSRARDDASGELLELGYEASEFDEDGLEYGDGLASLMESENHRKITREIEFRCSGFQLTLSRSNRNSLAKNWAKLLEELPSDLVLDDVVSAINSSEFEGLNSLSWGLLLSKSCVVRFSNEIRKNYDERKRLMQSTEKLFSDSIARLTNENSATRITAIERLSSTFSENPKIVLLFTRLLVGKHRDSDPDVRFAAAEGLTYLAANNLISEESQREITLRIKAVLKDNDERVREEIEYLLGQLGKSLAPVFHGLELVSGVS